jgi:ADP-sugar diphosphatase
MQACGVIAYVVGRERADRAFTMVSAWCPSVKDAAQPETAQPEIPAAKEQSDVIPIGSSFAVVTAESDVDMEKAIGAKSFTEWVSVIARNARIEISKLRIQSLDFNGSSISSLKFVADAKVGGNMVPSTVFMRGGTIAVLVVLKHGDERYTLMVRQPRVPVCKSSMQEGIEGMLDSDGNFSGASAKAMAQVGIEINESELINMTELAYGEAYPGMYPSCSASDEFNPIFLCRRCVSADEFAGLSKLTGEAKEGDTIKLQMIPLQNLWRVSPDAKMLSALCLHDKLIATGLIPDF